jgi:metal-dependent HD superfamily phosphatase/phosphodiesterase
MTANEQVGTGRSSPPPVSLGLVAAPTYVRTARAAIDILEARLQDRPRSRMLYDALVTDPEAIALWDLANYTAIGKLGYNDHGPLHARLTASAAVQLLDLLVAGGQVPDVVSTGVGDLDDATLVVVAAGMLHDVGNALHREGQARNGALLADPLLRRHLDRLSPDGRKAHLLRLLALAAINSHDTAVPPLTFGAGVVAVADAVDMTAGRGQASFERGRIDIHTVSALAIDRVTIRAGTDRPAHIDIEMRSDAGLFQVQETLVRKLLRTPLADLVSVTACVGDGSQSGAARVIDCVALMGGRLTSRPALHEPLR